MPDLKHQKPVHLEFSDSDNKIEIDNQQANTFDADSAIAYQQELLKLFDSLIHGEVEASQIQMTKMINSLKLFSSRNVALNQHNLITLNGQCALVLLNTNIHPVHIFKLHRALRTKVMKANTRESILNTASEMCRKYCLLVQNYAFTEYSKTVREVVNYINTHFEDDLNLSIIAQAFQKNASSLSASFSKEVGMSLTNYIHQTRINEAIRLFNSTEQSVSEVALAVGFHDFAYFSRLFHKQVGCSPREYCKKIR